MQTRADHTPVCHDTKRLYSLASLVLRTADGCRTQVEMLDRTLHDAIHPAQANRVVAALSPAERERIDPDGLSTSERDRLEQELSGLHDRVDFVARQIRHHRRLRDPGAPIHDIPAATDYRHHAARDAQLVAATLDRLARHLADCDIEPPEQLQHITQADEL